MCSVKKKLPFSEKLLTQLQFLNSKSSLFHLKNSWLLEGSFSINSKVVLYSLHDIDMYSIKERRFCYFFCHYLCHTTKRDGHFHDENVRSVYFSPFHIFRFFCILLLPSEIKDLWNLTRKYVRNSREKKLCFMGKINLPENMMK
jgi:hypothetical protein